MNHELMQDLLSVSDNLLTLQLNLNDMDNIPFEWKLVTADMYYKINHIYSWLARNYRKEENYV